MKNKILYLSLIITMLFSVTCFANVYENSESTQIAHGVTLNKKTMFTQNGWIYLDVIEIDVNNEDVKIGPLTSNIGVSNFSNIKNMVNENGAIAGLNGDYFAKRPNFTNRGQSIGLLGANGQILVSSADENISSQTMASFILNNDNSVIYSYLTDTITITSVKTGNTFIACDINKYVPYNSIGIFTSMWSEKSIGNSEGKEMIEVIVIDDVIKEIRQYLEPVEIPKDGYLLSAYGPDAIAYILDNFEVGDKIEYTVDINLDLEQMQFAISGGTMLVNNGQVPNFTHTVWGNNEMSAIGTNKRGNKIYLVACTAVNGSNTGISQKNFANILKEYGMYNALCLDGGGSTTMVAKELGNGYVSTILSRSNYLRPVVNGIGVFSLNKPSEEIGGLILELVDNYIFVDNTTAFSIKAYDTNYYAMDIDTSKLKVTFNNSNAKYKNGIITGLKEGTTKLTVEYMGKSATKQLQILGEIYTLEISPKETSISIDDITTFKLTGIDKNGYRNTIDNSLVKWEIVSGSGTLKKGQYTPSKHETVVISASIDNVKTYATIHINTEKTNIYDDFEELKGNFSAYPSTTVLGEVDISKSKKKNGKYSLKLTYDFTNNEQAVRGAYYDYTTPLELPNNISEIGIWVYSPEKNDNMIKSQYVDKKGNTYIDVLADKIDWTGWKYITYPSHSKVTKIVSIYVAQSNQDISNEGYIYIDDLTVTYYGNDTTNLITPTDVIKSDIDNSYLDNSYCVSIIDRIKNPSTLFDNIVNRKLIYSFNNGTDLLLTYEPLNNTVLDNISIPHEKISNYTVTDEKSLRIITINNENKGIRNTDYTQWENLIDDIDINKNILLILSNSLDNFSDTLEKELLLQTLQEKTKDTGKKCWIVQYGTKTNVENYNGIKIITIGKITSNNTIEKTLENYRYINIYITSKDISYEIKEIFE